MQTNRFFSRRATWLFLALVVIITFLTIISSCNGKKAEGEKESLGMSCMTLTSDLITKNWDKSYTNKIAVVKLYTTNVPRTNDYEVYVAAFDNAKGQLGGVFKLSSKACGINLSSFVTGKSNDINFSGFKIFQADGSLIPEFKEITFTPTVVNEGSINMLKYDVSIKLLNSTINPPDAGGYPCPPCVNCIPPCEPDCVPACTKEDSMKSHLGPYLLFVDTSKTK